MSNWKYPDDWVMPLEEHPANDGITMAAIFSGEKRFQNVRTLVFRRCSATGRYIWPFQKAWIGIMILRYSRTDMGEQFVYTIVWLSEDQYLIQKLKGNV